MDIALYSFSKMNKSTKVITSQPPLNIKAQLKDNCTVENPILLLDFEPVNYNYVYIEAWNRFYFIAGWQYIVGLWEISLTEDYLASFKSEILSTSAIIAYANHQENNIVDKRIPVKSSVTASNIVTAALDMVFLTTAYAPILSVTGKGSNGIYYVGYSDLPDLLDGVDQWFSDNVADFFDSIKQLFYGGSAANCLKSAIGLCWMPQMGAGEDLYLGNYPCKRSNGTNISGYKVTPIEKHDVNIDIPWRYSDWRRSEPYTTIRLFLPLIGNVSISADAAKNDSSFDITYAFNNTSGDVNVKVVGHSSGIIFNTSSANGSCGVQIGASNTNYGKITTSIGGGLAAVAGGAATLLTGGAALPAILGIGGGLAAAAGGTIAGLQGSTEGSGGLGGGSAIALGNVITCQCITRDLTDLQLNLALKMGKPLFKNDYVGSYTGYVQTEGFQFSSFNASSSEKDKINSLLDSGIYVE